MSNLNFPSWDQGWTTNALKVNHYIPYTPFSKTDRIGKIADWVAPALDESESKKEEFRGRKKLGPQIEAFGAGFTSAFSYQISATEEADFFIVDRAPSTKSKKGSKVPLPVASWGSKPSKKEYPSSQSKKISRGGQLDKNVRRDTSIKVEAAWEQVEELDFLRLSSLYFEVDEPVDVGLYGSLCFMEPLVEKVSVKSEMPLQGSNATNPNHTASEDPVLKKLQSETLGNTVIITDTVLAALMASTKSVYSWDIAITKKGNRLVFDKRENSALDQVSVNENAMEPPTEDKESMNSSVALCMEATFVDRVFKNQAVNSAGKVSFPQEIPFSSAVSTLYRYRKWSLGEDLSLFVRTHLDAVSHSPGSISTAGIPLSFESSYPQKETLFVSLASLLEYDSRVSNTPDWRKKLDSTRGAVLATEYKNNGFRLSLKATEAMLAGADQIRLGFLSRRNPKDRRRHDILGVQTFKPEDLAKQLNFEIYAGWAFTLLSFDGNDECFERFGTVGGAFNHRTLSPIHKTQSPEIKMALYALQKQLKNTMSHPIPGTRVSLVDEDIFKWEIGIVGPPGTIYQGGYFKALLSFPQDFPFSPPSFTFIKPLFHPNIYTDGKLCISILHPPGDDPLSGETAAERWNPTQTVESILLSVISLLSDPNLSSPANVDAGVMYRNDYESFVKIVKDQVASSLTDIPIDLKIPQSEAEWISLTWNASAVSPDSVLEEDNFWDESSESNASEEDLE